jgi:hypothetical protein
MRWIAIAHALPERTRLRCPALRRDDPACERLADTLARVPGVHAVHVRPYTGSVLIEHDPGVAAPALADEAARVLDCPKVLASGESPPVPTQVPAFSSLARKIVSAARELDRDIRRKSDGSVDLGTLATLGFVGAGAAQVATTGELPLPPWFNLAWWGFRTFVTSEQREIQLESKAGELPCPAPPV